MKKLSSKILMLIVALLMSTTHSKATDVLYAEIDGNTVTLKFGEVSKDGRAYTGEYKYSWTVFISNATSVIIDPSCKNFNGTSLSNLFISCRKIETITGLNNLNTSNVTNMYRMFHGCNKLTSIDLSGFDTSNVTNMGGMFSGCSSLTSLDVSSFNTANVTNMESMFYICQGLTSLDLSSFNTANVTNMYAMFQSSSGLTSLDLSSFNTTNVTDMSAMFDRCTNLKNIYVGDGWDTSNVTKSDFMFTNCPSLEGEGGASGGNKTDKSAAYVGPGGSMSKKTLYAVVDGNNLILKYGTTESGSYVYTGTESWNTTFASTVTIGAIDESCKKIIGENLSYLFADCENLENITGLDNLNISNASNLSNMFYQCEKLATLDLSGWNTSNVTNMSNMFRNCESLKTIYVDDNWNTASVNASSNMFRDCISIKGEDGTTYDSSKRDVAYAHTGTGGYLTKATTEVRNVSSSTIRNNVSLKKIIKDGIILIGDHNVAGERIK